MRARYDRFGGSSRLEWRPLLSGWYRYPCALLIVGAAVGCRHLLQPWFGANVAYLQFFPAILLVAWWCGLGPGVLATGVSVLLAMYLFLPPDGFAVSGPADWVSLTIFAGTAVSICWLNHALRHAEAAQRTAAALATARAERLDAVFNTAVDGIIVISAEGTIERFNRGAERLFGFPESEVVGRNVSMLMPSPYHEEHDEYLNRYTVVLAAARRSAGPASFR